MTTVVNLQSSTVVVPDTNGNTTTTEIHRTSVVVAGQLGPAGASTLSDLLDVSINAVENGDLLTKQGSYWVNVRRANVTDGGNF